MAKLFPSVQAHLRTDAGYFRELDVLNRLEKSLPDGYEIFHSVDWQSHHDGGDWRGEIDVIVMNQAGNLLLMEVKGGHVEFRTDGIFKQYGKDVVQVDRQIKLQFSALLGRLKKAGLNPLLKNCLVLPDCRVLDGNIAGIERDRIFDSEDFDRLGSLAIQVLPQGAHNPQADDVRRFLRNMLNIAPDVSVLHTQLKDASHRLADGLATWVTRMESPSGVFRIQATAGSGKTQLALRLLDDAAAQQQRAQYVCYNRPLADHIAKLAPARAEVGTFHEICIDHFRRKHGEPDFAEHGIFARVEQTYIEAVSELSARLDLLIIDEAQDFSPEWVTGMAGQLKADGRLYLLEDDNQRLYDRESFELSDAVLLRCDDNFRSPKMICEVINGFQLTDRPIIAKSPHHGQIPDFIVCDDPAEFRKRTAEAVERLIARGFRLSEIAVLTVRGHERSGLLRGDRIGQHLIRRFSGAFSRNGDPLWTVGDLLAESVYRFKGQSAPAVILTEVDFDDLSDADRRRLFVGMTRAQMALTVVLSARAEQALALRM